MMQSFWEKSWMNIKEERIEEYLQKMQAEPDELIDYLRQLKVYTICDAGCGCGAYMLKLAANGFEVSGFDVSAHAVDLSQKLLSRVGLQAKLKTASVLCTGYKDNQFDCVLSRDVIDHMSKQDAKSGLKELVRITKPGGRIIAIVDFLDEEYEEQPHFVNQEGDYIFTAGKWNGVIFHPYTEKELWEILPNEVDGEIKKMREGFYIEFRKAKKIVEGDV